MGIRKCSHCGQEVEDDLIEVCPNCGEKIDLIQSTDETSESIIEETKNQSTEEVSTILEEKEVEPQKPKQNSKKKLGIIIAAFIIIIAVGGFMFKSYSDSKAKKAYNDYIDNTVSTQKLILSGATRAEELSILTLKVWNNSIWKKSSTETDAYTKSNGVFYTDFNDAIFALNADITTINTKTELTTNLTTVSGKIKDLQNPPKGLESCYESMLNLYTSYQSAMDFAQNPSGSLTSYTSSKTTTFQDFLDNYNKLDAKIPEKKK